MLSFFSRKVAVTFVDADSQEVLGQTSLAPEQLPETFLLDTTMHLGDQDWSVVSAVPPTRAEYAKTRKLVLRLRRVRTTTVNPADLLFSLPTINDSLPDDAEPADGTEFVLLEDEWRQIELVHEQYLDLVAAELADIEKICDEHRNGIGFTKCHVRKRIPAPLPNEIPLPTFGTSPDTRLRLHGHDRRVSSGFAYSLSGEWHLYGTRGGSGLTTLALDTGREALSPADREALARFANENGLLVVNWCSRVHSTKSTSLDAFLT